MKAEKSEQQTEKPHLISDEAFADLKEAMEEVLAFERCERRDFESYLNSGSESAEDSITSARCPLRGSQMIASRRAVCYKTTYERAA
jgi:hypothetical protein